MSIGISPEYISPMSKGMSGSESTWKAAYVFSIRIFQICLSIGVPLTLGILVEKPKVLMIVRVSGLLNNPSFQIAFQIGPIAFSMGKFAEPRSKGRAEEQSREGYSNAHNFHRHLGKAIER
jgi:hypothetical protein